MPKQPATVTGAARTGCLNANQPARAATQASSGTDTAAVTTQAKCARLAGDPGDEVVPKSTSVLPLLHRINWVVEDV